jgi:uncharacterized protein YndB with AHSA1/START domain
MKNEGIVATAEMLIRRPVSNVFEAFVDPAITSKFWFSHGSGKLEVEKSVRWDWEMYGFSTEARVKGLQRQPAGDREPGGDLHRGLLVCARRRKGVA